MNVTDLLDKITHLSETGLSNRVQRPGVCADQHSRILQLIKQNRQFVGNQPFETVEISIDAVAGTCHASWLADGDRSYSPVNAPWSALTEEQRRQVSRSAAITLSILTSILPDGLVRIVDEYDPPTEYQTPGIVTSPADIAETIKAEDAEIKKEDPARPQTEAEKQQVESDPAR